MSVFTTIQLSHQIQIKVLSVETRALQPILCLGSFHETQLISFASFPEKGYKTVFQCKIRTFCTGVKRL